MSKVYNLSRAIAQKFKKELNKDKTAWISIEEPGRIKSVVSNKSLESINFLKISFWDLTKTVDKYNAPRKEDAKKIVDFLLANSCKSIIVNCAVGISRSGAVAKFCQDKLGYEWPDYYKVVSDPNPLLYSLMVEYHLKHFKK